MRRPMSHRICSTQGRPRAGIGDTMTHQHKARARLALRMFACFLVLSAGATTQAQNAEPFKFFREYVGLNDGQIAAIRGGKALAKIVESRTADEVVYFSAASLF